MTRSSTFGLASSLVFAAAQLAGCGQEPADLTGTAEEALAPVETGAPQLVPHRLRGAAEGAVTVGSTGVVTPAITHHGGPVIGTPTAYVIWHGNWNQANGSDNAAGQQIVRDFLANVGGSPYFKINQTYSIASTAVTGNVGYGGEATSTSTSTRLRDADILKIVNGTLDSGALPYDPNGVYFVLTSSNVAESSGFCTKYCGWHTAGTATKGHVRYSFVGNANRCLSGCAAQSVSPNGNAGVDGMVSVIAHELEEATSDPDLNAWYDSGGAENADKCAWTFGNYSTLPSGAAYNMTLGARNYLIQRNLKHAASGDTCTLQ
ncbi:MAG: hypothetical protein QM704_16120 [Anaeromyxobacteraceae bacterium]